MTGIDVTGPSGAREWLRRIGLGVLAGAVAGLLVGGIGGRAFMFALAQLNPPATGVTSDDGFIVGRFTIAGTLNLLLVGTVIGAIAGSVWVAARGLRFGWGWWRAVSMPLAATIVIGSIMVHSDGVDFTLLEPAWLAIALTLCVPLLATVVVTSLGDRWIGDGPTVWQAMPVVVAWLVRAGLTAFVAMAALDLLGTIDEILRDD